MPVNKIAVSLTLMSFLCGASADDQAISDSITITDCVVRAIAEARVPAHEPGVIESINVIEGDRVKAGDLMARLDQEEAEAKLRISEAELEIALKQATSDIRVQLARAEAEVAETEYLRGNSTTTDVDEEQKKQLRRLLLAPRRAQLKAGVAELDQEILKLNSKVKIANTRAAKVQLNRRQVVSPLDGIVVQVYQHAGEWSNPGEPIFHVVQMDRQRVVGYVSADDAAPEEVLGRAALIIVHDRRGLKRELTSKIAFASQIVESSGQYRIWAEVENRQENGSWLLRPGLTADMTIQLK